MSEDADARELARRELESALSEAASRRSALFLTAAFIVLVAAGLFAMLAVPWGGLAHASADDLLLAAADLALLAVALALLVGALRARGPRGTRAGRIVLDAPASVELAQHFVRERHTKQDRRHPGRARKVHVIGLAFADGTTAELPLAPRTAQRTLEALRVWLPPSAQVDAPPPPE